MIEFRCVKKRFGKVEALKGVSFKAQRGVLALLGPNGAGKTTLVKVACGVLLPDEGDVLFDGRSVLKESRSLFREIGAVFENAENVYGYLSVWANLRFFAELWDLPKTALELAEELLRELGLWERRRSPVNELSRGNKQKVALVMAFMKSPKYLFLDEPTLGLDLVAASKVEGFIERWVKEMGATVVLTTHRLDLAWRLGSRFALISGGKLIWEGSKPQLRSLPLWKRRYRLVFRASGEVREEEVDGNDLNARLRALAASGAELVEVRVLETQFEEVVKELLESSDVQDG